MVVSGNSIEEEGEGGRMGGGEKKPLEPFERFEQFEPLEEKSGSGVGCGEQMWLGGLQGDMVTLVRKCA